MITTFFTEDQILTTIDDLIEIDKEYTVVVLLQSSAELAEGIYDGSTYVYTTAANIETAIEVATKFVLQDGNWYNAYVPFVFNNFVEVV